MHKLSWIEKMERLRRRIEINGQSTSEPQSVPNQSSSAMMYEKLRDYMELKTSQSPSTSSTPSAIKKLINVKSWSLGEHNSSERLRLTKNGEELCVFQDKCIDGQTAAPPSLIGAVNDALLCQSPAESVLHTINYSDFVKYGDQTSSSSSMSPTDTAELSMKSLWSTIESPHNVTDFASIADNLTVDLTDHTEDNDETLPNHNNPNCDVGHEKGSPMNYAACCSGGGGDYATIVAGNIQPNHVMHKSQSQHNAANALALIDNGMQFRKLAQQSLNSIRNEIKVLEDLLDNE